MRLPKGVAFSVHRVGVCYIIKSHRIHFGACTTQQRKCIKAILCVQRKKKTHENEPRARKKLTKKLTICHWIFRTFSLFMRRFGQQIFFRWFCSAENFLHCEKFCYWFLSFLRYCCWRTMMGFKVFCMFTLNPLLIALCLARNFKRQSCFHFRIHFGKSVCC